MNTIASLGLMLVMSEAKTKKISITKQVLQNNEKQKLPIIVGFLLCLAEVGPFL